MYPFYEANKHTISKPSSTGHYGLFYERFFAWNNDYSQSSKEWTAKKNRFINLFDGEIGNQQHLDRVWQRQLGLLERQRGKFVVAKTDWHFVIGMGETHPIENGFTWHHTLGVPYVPGSSFKGIVRAYCEAESELESQQLIRWFGSDDKDVKNPDRECGTGGIVFFDAIPTNPVTMAPDILTPHTGDWLARGGSGETAPGDYHVPTPVSFVACKNAVFLFSFTKVGHIDISDAEMTELNEVVRDALTWYGIGGKTSVGYGSLSIQTESDKAAKPVYIYYDSLEQTQETSSTSMQSSASDQDIISQVEALWDDGKNKHNRNEITKLLSEKFETLSSDQISRLCALLDTDEFAVKKRKMKPEEKKRLKLRKLLASK